MNESNQLPISAQTPGSTIGFWPRFRTAFAPALVGLVGGALSAGIGYVSMVAILKACSATYAKFPSLPTPWLMADFTPPVALAVPLFLLALAAPFAMGMATARLVRPKDRWEAVSAGLTTATTASATAYVLWIGWATTLATVIVPSISDFTVFAQSTRTPTEATANPSDVLTEPYPDLKAIPANERGDLFFPKIVSDQVVGSAYGIWYGVILSIAAVGVPGLCGTLAATRLLGRSGRCSRFFSYIELTVATSVPIGLLVFAVVPTGYQLVLPMVWIRYAAIVVMSAVVVAGALNRWNWPIRLVAAFAWALVLLGVGIGEHRYGATACAAYAVYAGLAFLLLQKCFPALGRRAMGSNSPQTQPA